MNFNNHNNLSEESDYSQNDSRDNLSLAKKEQQSIEKTIEPGMFPVLEAFQHFLEIERKKSQRKIRLLAGIYTTIICVLSFAVSIIIHYHIISFKKEIKRTENNLETSKTIIEKALKKTIEDENNQLKDMVNVALYNSSNIIYITEKKLKEIEILVKNLILTNKFSILTNLAEVFKEEQTSLLTLETSDMSNTTSHNKKVQPSGNVLTETKFYTTNYTINIQIKGKNRTISWIVPIKVPEEE